ncbi:MAG TPA: glycosyl transferase [Lachnospiraceae bacterium]|nr:glycosyl transferase [Lachnospiraceae bacterium]
MEYSVLMTVYGKDNPEYFRKALLSMVKQTKTPDEIVLVKDGPITEELQSVIDKVDKKYPNFIVQVQLPTNLGLGLALNEGIKICKNELLARMDADDISLPGRCEKQVAAFEENPALDIVGCPVIEFIGEPDCRVGKRKVPLDNEAIYQYCKKRDPFNHPTVMYRKSKVVSVGCYGNLRKNQDTDLWIRMLSKGAVCANLPEYLFLFRFDENTYKKRKNWLNTKLLFEIRWRAFRSGFCSFIDFLEIAVAQIAIFTMPVKFQKFIYKNLLRR